MPSECRICLGRHDAEIHDATVSIHGWLRREISRRTEAKQIVFEPSPIEAADSFRWSCQ
jgi:hypothetical protein